MHQLSPFTCRRLSQLPRLTSVWECDRRSLDGMSGQSATKDSETSQGDCIIWADGLHGVVRGLDVVPHNTGNEAIVRTLLQAIESPQGGVEPARPRKVVVRDREIQFFLRGALQDLDIPVEYVSDLPLIDDVFAQIKAPHSAQAQVSTALEDTLKEKASLIWKAAPWAYLSDQEILAVELNHWEIETLYLSVLGFAGMEYGLLFYRNLASLQQFRSKLLEDSESSEGMQQAFLEQNCLFVNFNPTEKSNLIALPSMDEQSVPDELLTSAIYNSSTPVDYDFGSLHPLEGLRSQLAEEEAASLIVALEALHRFCNKHNLGTEDFSLKPLSSRFKVSSPLEAEVSDGISKKDSIAVKISTVPEVTAAFLEEATSAPPLSSAPLVDDSIPDGALIMMGAHKDNRLVPLREQPRIHYQSFLDEDINQPGDKANWPVVTIQTTRPKAKKLLERLRSEGGVQAICFNSGNDPISGQIFKVGMLQTARGHLHLFNEYEIDNAVDSRSLEMWTQSSAQNHQCCGLILATGATGIKRGQPTIKEIVAFFEMVDKPPQALGLAPLIMSYL